MSSRSPEARWMAARGEGAIRMRRVIFVFVCAVVVAVCIGGAAVAAELPEPPYTETDECYACHAVESAFGASAVDFSVGAVDYLRCGACHLGMPGLWHYHFGYAAVSTPFGPVACLDCHDGEAAFEFDLPEGATAVVGYRAPTEYGYFETIASVSTPASSLHAIHAGTGWVEQTFGGGCSRCHAAAACSACHGPSVGHTDHAVSDYPAVSVKQALGATVSYAPSTCVNPSCHALAAAGTEGFVPECAECHAAHADLSSAHLASASAECVACHESGDVLVLHTDPGACVLCHTGAALPETTDCGGCHDLSPVTDKHYPAAAHLAASQTGCPKCHSMDLFTEHAKPTVAVSCVACHETSVDALAGSWDGTCAACHPDQHKQRQSGGGR